MVDDAEAALNSYDLNKEFKAGDRVRLARLPADYSHVDSVEACHFKPNDTLTVARVMAEVDQAWSDVTVGDCLVTRGRPEVAVAAWEAGEDCRGICIVPARFLEPVADRLKEDKAKDALKAYDKLKEFKFGDKVKLVSPAKGEGLQWQQEVTVAKVMTAEDEGWVDGLTKAGEILVTAGDPEAALNLWNDFILWDRQSRLVKPKEIELVLREDRAEDALTALDNSEQFEVGDRVRVRECYVANTDGKTGTISKVTRPDPVSLYFIDYDQPVSEFAKGCCFFAHELERLYPPVVEDQAEDAFKEVTTFRVGDSVLYPTYAARLGVRMSQVRLGTVRAIDSSPIAIWDVAVQRYDGGTEWFHSDELSRPVTEDKAEDAFAVYGREMELVPGARVTVNSAQYSIKNEPGVITDVSDDLYLVHFDDKHYAVPEPAFDLVGKFWASKHELSVLIPVAEDNAEDALDVYDEVLREFKVGDRVIAKSGLSWTQRGGTVKEIEDLGRDPGHSWVTVKWDVGPYGQAPGPTETFRQRDLEYYHGRRIPRARKLKEDKAEDAFDTLDNLHEFAVGDLVETRYGGSLGKVTKIDLRFDCSVHIALLNSKAARYWRRPDELKLVKPAVTEAKNPRLGKCYQLSGDFVLGHPDAVLVHGTLINPFNKGYKELPHAWVEIGDQILDPVMGQSFPKEVYEALFKVTVAHRYTHQELLKYINQYEHWGPWDELTEDNAEDAFSAFTRHQDFNVGDRVIVIEVEDRIEAWFKDKVGTITSKTELTHSYVPDNSEVVVISFNGGRRKLSIPQACYHMIARIED